ncbi:hypothetical protein LXL04_017077 [Taraxacum kok-saghyz]
MTIRGNSIIDIQIRTRRHREQFGNVILFIKQMLVSIDLQFYTIRDTSHIHHLPILFMGGLLSVTSSKPNESLQISQSESNKRQKTSPILWDDNPRLIPNLPDEISLLILARLPRICYLTVKSVSRTWKLAVTTPEIYKVRKELGTTEEWLYILTKNQNDRLFWHALDPLSKKWQKLPPIPDLPSQHPPKHKHKWGPSARLADTVRGWLGRTNGPDQIPLCGCAIGAVDGSLYMLGGFSKSTAVNSVYKYDPVSNKWTESSSMCVGRAYCKTGVLNNKLFVVGGVSRCRGGLTPLQSAEVFDPKTGVWSEIPNMPFSKAQVLPTAFLADLLKPIATGLTCYRGKLYVPQSLYCWPFYVDVGGEVYDPESDSWVDMPVGMGEGWPAKQAGTKLSVIVDGELYALDPSSSLESARIKVYDCGDDSWKVVEGDVPIRDFAESESPYLLAGLLGKLHVVTKDGNQNVAVMQAGKRSGGVGDSDSGSGEGSSESESNIWSVIASRSFESAELTKLQKWSLWYSENCKFGLTSSLVASMFGVNVCMVFLVVWYGSYGILHSGPTYCVFAGCYSVATAPCSSAGGQNHNISILGFNMHIHKSDHLGLENSSSLRLQVESAILNSRYGLCVVLNSCRKGSSFCHSSHLSDNPPSPSSIFTTSDIFGRFDAGSCMHKSDICVNCSTSSST